MLQFKQYWENFLFQYMLSPLLSHPFMRLCSKHFVEKHDKKDNSCVKLQETIQLCLVIRTGRSSDKSLKLVRS